MLCLLCPRLCLTYLTMSSLCLRKCFQKSISSNILFCKIKKVFSNHQHYQLTFLGSKKRYLCVYALTLFINLRVVDTMLPIAVKVAFILKLKLVNTQVFHIIRTKGPNLKQTAIKDHMLISSKSEFHLKIRESQLISRDQPISNKNEAFLPLHLFD